MLQRVPQDIIWEIRRKFTSLHKKIKAFEKPWPPWALVHLLDIDDKDSPIPAEKILYQALEGRKNGGLAIKTFLVRWFGF